MARHSRHGLSFDRLRVPGTEILATVEGAGSATFARQKHPVQLGALTFLPQDMHDDPHVVAAQRDRYAISDCENARREHYYGWTLFAFMLASVRRRDVGGFARDLGRLDPGGAIDSEAIQIYETSRLRRAPYYTTSGGLFLQAVLDAFVTDARGPREERTCVPPGWESARVVNLRTAPTSPTPKL